MSGLCSRFDGVAVAGLTAMARWYPYGRTSPGGPGEPHESEEDQMDITRIEASVETHAATFDTLARSANARLPRRRVVGLLAAAFATTVFGVSRDSAETAAATSIPPNCIYVCCDGTCDSWKMCMRCVKWPKPTTTTAVASQ
jgi:hypothetical protein